MSDDPVRLPAGFVPAHEIVGRQGEVVLLLHGILGAGRNWRSFARRLAAGPPERRVLLPDLRLHGASRDAPPPDTIAACAADLERLAQRTGLAPAAVAGHSFGGKVAVAFAETRPPGLERVVVLDSPLSPERPHETRSSLPLELLAFCERNPGPFASRGEVISALVGQGVPEGVARWFATNLARTPEGFRFLLDPVRLRSLLEDYFRFDALTAVERIAPPLAVTVVRAGRGGRVGERDAARLRALQSEGRPVRLVELAGAGHWLHVDDPEGTLRVVREALGYAGS